MFDNENRGLSPVIGVVMLVGLTVILVAVIGGFVTDAGGDIGSAPNAQIGVSFDTDESNVTLSHNGGSDINPETLKVQYENGSTTSVPFNTAKAGSDVEGLIQAGEEVTLDGSNWGVSNMSSGDTLSIIWTGESGDSRDVLLEEIVP